MRLWPWRWPWTRFEEPTVEEVLEARMKSENLHPGISTHNKRRQSHGRTVRQPQSRKRGG